MAKNRTGAFRFRVSDAVEVPLRGMMLRLKRVDGQPSLAALKPGASIHLQAPDGETRDVAVKDAAVTGGRVTQEKLEKYGQVDVIIGAEDALAGGRPVGIGWFVVGG